MLVAGQNDFVSFFQGNAPANVVDALADVFGDGHLIVIGANGLGQQLFQLVIVTRITGMDGRILQRIYAGLQDGIRADPHGAVVQKHRLSVQGKEAANAVPIVRIGRQFGL